MPLSSKQLTSLRHDLIALTTIKYDDVMTELLDHYASLTEQKMATGMEFDDASKWAWAELGGGEGMQKIQTAISKNIQYQVRTKHISILKSYFRWPTFVTTMLVGILICIIVPTIPVRWVITGIYLAGLLPALFLLAGYVYGLHNQTDSGQLVWKYVQHKGLLPLNLIQLGIYLPNIYLEKGSQMTRTFLQTDPSLSVLICLPVLLYTASFIQLFRHQYKYKFA